MIEPDALAEDAPADDAPEPAPDAAEPATPALGELTEAQLEALLFVAEKPLTRREIGLLAGVDRATVDARLGDLEVSLAARGIRLILSGEHVELTTAPEAGALVARYVGADAVRLSPAALETLAIVAYRQPVTRATDRADPRRRLRLHRPRAPAPPPGRRAGALGCPGPAVPVRDRLRVPRAVRPDLARGAAGARSRRRDAAGRGGRGGRGGRRAGIDVDAAATASPDPMPAERTPRSSRPRAWPPDAAPMSWCPPAV